MDNGQKRTLSFSQGSLLKVCAALLCAAAIFITQRQYDAANVSVSPSKAPFSSELIRMLDLGFHSTAASFLWIKTMPEIIKLNDAHPDYVTDAEFVNAVDPKLSYPYAYSVITLPAVSALRYKEAVQEAIEIGEKGIENAHPDWRIPFYLAADYFLELKDRRTAIKYFDMAAHTPGIPDAPRRYSLNFGISNNQRGDVEELWQAIYDSATDDVTRARAKIYVTRLEIIDYLARAIGVYRNRYGKVPQTLDELVEKKIIPSIPVDPLGFEFRIINEEGEIGVNLDKLPSYFTK